MATIAPEHLGWAALIKDIINPGIDKASNGRVYLDWYYGGKMGDDEDIIARMRNGQLQGGGFSGHGMVILCPEMTLFSLLWLIPLLRKLLNQYKRRLYLLPFFNMYFLLFLIIPLRFCHSRIPDLLLSDYLEITIIKFQNINS